MELGAEDGVLGYCIGTLTALENQTEKKLENKIEAAIAFGV